MSNSNIELEEQIVGVAAAAEEEEDLKKKALKKWRRKKFGIFCRRLTERSVALGDSAAAVDVDAGDGGEGDEILHSSVWQHRF